MILQLVEKIHSRRGLAMISSTLMENKVNIVNCSYYEFFSVVINYNHEITVSRM